jgi:hypothetical protein
MSIAVFLNQNYVEIAVKYGSICDKNSLCANLILTNISRKEFFEFK